MSHRSESVGESSRNGTAGSGVPAWVDWLVGAGIGLVGLLLLGIGGALTALLDRATIADLVRDGTVRGDLLTGPELVAVATPTVFWTGIGLSVAGIVLLAGAGAYAYYQRQFQRAAGTSDRVSNFRANAVAGAVSALVLSFIPFSQALGGAIAGYLEHDASGKSTRVGALSGLIGVVPALLVVPFVLVGIASGAAAIGDQGLTFLVGGIVLVAMLVGAVFAAGLGALGGYAGGVVADDGF